MLVRQESGVPWYQFPGLAARPALVHGVSGRAGGQSTGPHAALNVSYAVGDDPSAVRRNRDSFCAALGVPAGAVVCAQQIHGSRVARVSAAEKGRGYVDRTTAVPDADGLVTDQRGILLWLTFADCVPIVLCDPVRQAVGVIHAGWRGTAAAIAIRGVEALAREFGSQPDDILAGIGPAIGPCCYRVGAEVVDAFRALLGRVEGVVFEDQDGGQRVDLVGANVELLTRAGIRREHVEVSEYCTACRVDLFYSHRAEMGKTGRFAAVAGLGPWGTA